MVEFSVFEPFPVEELAIVTEQHVQVKNRLLRVIPAPELPCDYEFEIMSSRGLNPELLNGCLCVTIVATENQGLGLGITGTRGARISAEHYSALVTEMFPKLSCFDMIEAGAPASRTTGFFAMHLTSCSSRRVSRLPGPSCAALKGPGLARCGLARVPGGCVVFRTRPFGPEF